MKTKLILSLLLAASFFTHAQTKSKTSSAGTPKNWGIGLRLGDPTAVTLKKYLANGRALEFNLGSSDAWGYDYHHYFIHESHAPANATYNGYDRKLSLCLQVHYLFQKPFPDAKGLNWYWGFGGQFRARRYDVYYTYPAQTGFRGERDKVTNIDLGADGVIGLEYDIPKAPLSVFADANLFLEIVDDPFDLFFQGGVGIRYNF